ncbi:hypothetical protein [Actinoplanes sp. NPDC049265]|uniref:hypothetical protein n=1 Tax=Actinoplanes sp. NPDC049265 TaxID=3363902 RepID=UPI00371E42F1
MPARSTAPVAPVLTGYVRQVRSPVTEDGTIVPLLAHSPGTGDVRSPGFRGLGRREHRSFTIVIA